MHRWEEINEKMKKLDREMVALHMEWTQIKAQCPHSNLPIRQLGEEYMDRSPDCGYISYMTQL
jgi:hypothetical protein